VVGSVFCRYRLSGAVRRVAAFLLQDDGYPSFVAPRAGFGQVVDVGSPWSGWSPWGSRWAQSWSGWSRPPQVGGL